jgi:hypothetical protein
VEKKRTLISLELVFLHSACVLARDQMVDYILVGQVIICTNESNNFNMLQLPDKILNKICKVSTKTKIELNNYSKILHEEN